MTLTFHSIYLRAEAAGSLKGPVGPSGNHSQAIEAFDPPQKRIGVSEMGVSNQLSNS